MFRRALVPTLLLLAAVSTGCQTGIPAGGISGRFPADRGDGPRYASDRVSDLVKEAAAEESQQLQQRPQAHRGHAAPGAQQAMSNTAMSY